MKNATKQEQATVNRRDLHQHVTDTIIRQLETGVAPWQKPWQGDELCLSLPYNFTTGNNYQGINILLLWTTAFSNNYQSAEWASFKQWQDKKEVIRKGEKGTLIVYYDTFEKEEEGEIKKIPFLKSSIVFNRCQLASYTPNKTTSIANSPTWERVNAMEQFVKNTKAVVKEHDGDAIYIKAEDHILMPKAEYFIQTYTVSPYQGYYTTLMHELTHWTGHPTRLNRQFGRRFADKVYAAEELLAELGASFLCADLGLPIYETGHNANYIANWLIALRNDKHFIFAAASEASKAVGYLHSLQPA